MRSVGVRTGASPFEVEFGMLRPLQHYEWRGFSSVSFKRSLITQEVVLRNFISFGIFLAGHQNQRGASTSHRPPRQVLTFQIEAQYDF
jgi:hypothetical protein